MVKPTKATFYPASKGFSYQPRKDGYGELFWPDGKFYKGHWKEGTQHGKGIFKGIDGIEKHGQWFKGKRVVFEKNEEN
jgi:hypothetical protein